MKNFIKAIAFASLFSSPAMAKDCAPEFTEASTTVTVGGVNVGANEVSRENFNIRVRNEGRGRCTASIRVARIDGANIGSPLAYSLRSGSNSIDILPTEASAATAESDFLVNGIPGGANGRAVPFIVTVPTRWGIEAGFRSEQFLLTLLDAAGEVLDRHVLTINMQIPSSVSMRLVGATGTETIRSINLGTIGKERPNQSDPFGVRVWSTSPYSVSFTSENAGVLAHEAGLDQIPYDLRMDNMLVNLVTGSEFTIPSVAPPLGIIHRLSVQAGPATARAGSYSDRVTVTVSPL